MPSLPRLVIYATARRLNTFREVRRKARATGFAVKLMAYETAARRRRLPAGSAIFTDFERMSPPWLEVAATLRARTLEAGGPVLNDPARFLPRAALLRALQAEGINRFGCWLPALGERPERFPCFLRTGWAHRGVLGDLLQNAQEAEAALEAALKAGHTLSDLMFIEYAGLAREGGVFRKRAAYAVAGEVVPALTVSQRHWVAKSGEVGAASAAQYAADEAEMHAYPHVQTVRRVMALAGQQFGRVDFGLTEGGVAVFELNTNPYIRFGSGHPDPERVKTQEGVEARLMQSLHALAEQGRGAPAPDLAGAFGWRGLMKLSPKMP
ncbi:hypothetical protein [Vannielia litorea]|uniref:hypothetical protein n=1 Tax=Vannielia litorea TaxID=1217970 RepID=UPI001C938807|nr:hypothetical protein [Vannielia litorea]MBY6046188.1 hypothetical protein [Vannielia litorea]MBY6073601.1 hypothetical protein [Vannielia litorea]